MISKASQVTHESYKPMAYADLKKSTWCCCQPRSGALHPCSL